MKKQAAVQCLRSASDEVSSDYLILKTLCPLCQIYLAWDASILICGFVKCHFTKSSLSILHVSLGSYEIPAQQQDFTKHVCYVESCFPFCKPSSIVRGSFSAPGCVEIATKLCIKLFPKMLNLLCTVCEQQGMEYLAVLLCTSCIQNC